jgi:hypothetical protein
MSFDIEISGKAAGIIQMLAETFWVKIALRGKVGKDHIKKKMLQRNIHGSLVGS